ncbi:type II toxin-antitoxin system ParD family antitoxin [Thiomicrorhabdus sp. Kp2]|uniref:type II toxin-antitoxin system ParD family antitoxin n=1 Tax=Thiomicrorhabdus sp. Kp2 TaxID=1123518 RepID=UPI0003F9F94E|nr:type II toxin-antitoxin system ParD family antitoxin [Thiomicrorhabdus sp. Kp2]MDX1351635.1 type II toxin-antitoxin system ParD family antitoxin [Thiomicrorhabdus sp.]
MNISLTPELENRIKAKVATGLYNNASEVVREALRFVEMNQEWIDEVKLATLRKQLDVGMNELDQGKGIEIESYQALDQFFDDIQQHRID